jgi:hypothetical protein
MLYICIICICIIYFIISRVQRHAHPDVVRDVLLPVAHDPADQELVEGRVGHQRGLGSGKKTCCKMRL